MTEKARKELDALDLLMQDHREMESLFSEFEYLRQNGRNTGRVIANACAELKIHDTLETEIFYPAVGKAAEDEEIDGLMDEAEEEHDTILELIEKLEQTRTDHKQRDAYFTILAGHVKHHVLGEETERFPVVKKLKRLDLDSVTAAMKKRKAELMAETGIAEADEETV
ncbi:MAG: hemerythrin domain-containing protein [Betaproteobacteria bacterium]|nr:hemerythrin domain-containing protein [Betaproteobacteria bacterium]